MSQVAAGATALITAGLLIFSDPQNMFENTQTHRVARAETTEISIGNSSLRQGSHVYNLPVYGEPGFDHFFHSSRWSYCAGMFVRGVTTCGDYRALYVPGNINSDACTWPSQRVMCCLPFKWVRMSDCVGNIPPGDLCQSRFGNNSFPIGTKIPCGLQKWQVECRI